MSHLNDYLAADHVVHAAADAHGIPDNAISVHDVERYAAWTDEPLTVVADRLARAYARRYPDRVRPHDAPKEERT